jgi:chromate transporter
MKGSPISFREAMQFWLKLGFISFGGPAGQIAIMHRELVEERRWISEKRFLHALNYCMVLPGPEAQQLATYLGWLMHGTPGGVLAGVFFILPSLAILIALSWGYVTYGDVPTVQAIFYGIKPAVTAIVLAAAWRIGTKALTSAALVAIAVASFLAMFAFDVPFPAIVVGAAVIGWAGGRWVPRAFASFKLHNAKTSDSNASAIVDDNTPPPSHARVRGSRIALTACACVALWAIAFALIVFAVAPNTGNATLAHMSWFFTKASLLTFGGAYAVLPYVYQGAVESFQWVTAQQMMDGLALGETTPGPLIMVVAFVAYLGGTANDVVQGSPFLSGALAACVVTFFTFLPSFFFILVGAPFIEATRENLQLAAPMSAITAAVVGVIVKLGLFFAWHTWWPTLANVSNTGNASNPSAGAAFQGMAFLAHTDWIAVGITIAAAIALIRYKQNVMWVIAAAGAMGVIAHALR